MRRSITAVGFIMVALAALSGLLACSSSNNTGNISSIAISPTSASVQIATETEFTATVKLQNTTTTTDTAVTWEVNGTAGGSSTVGTIVSSTTDPEVGIYTAPATVPAVNNGQVNITAVSQVSTTTTSTSSSTTTSGVTAVTSNTAVVTITATGLVGLSVTPVTTTVPAGGALQFAATQNGVGDTNAVWSVSSTNGGNVGTIGAQTGIYTAPLSPPPGGTVTITAADGSNSSTATATITYSDHTLKGPYAFSYKGNDSSGFRAVAGSFVADGNGNITSGVEDIESFLTGISSQVTLTGTYQVRTDGRTTVTLNPSLQTASTLQFALTTNAHGLMIRFNSSNTGSGTVDEQNLNALSNLPSGPYVFGVSGTDASFGPLGMAGEFFASNGTIAASANSILDVNDAGVVTRADRSLNGSYAFDNSFPGTGRGTVTLASTPTGSRQYVFYMIDGTRIHLVEIDRGAFTAGDVFSAPTGNSFTASSLTGNYVFTAGGNSGANAHIAGGIFTSNGSGTITAGAFDSNGAGTAKLGTAISSCAYAVDLATGRVDLSLFLTTGTCAPGASTAEFALYPTAQASAVILELDSSAVATGIAYSQQVATSPFSGNSAFNLGGQGLFHNALISSFSSDAEGQLTLAGTSASAGNLDINTYNSAFTSDLVNISSTSISAPASNGRGTFVLAGTNPLVTYNLIYYVIDANTALLFDGDSTRLALGAIARQF
jgi:hypothetical protein